MEHQMIETLDTLQDAQTASWYLFVATFRWFGLYLDMLIGVYYAILLVVVFQLPVGGIPTRFSTLQEIMLLMKKNHRDNYIFY